MLDGRFSDGVEVARRALDAAVATGMRSAEGHARNTLGFCLAMIGEVEPGAEQLREAIRIARERDHLPDLSDAYNNYSDMLHIVGRTTEALSAVADGLEAVGGRRPVAMMWLECQRAEFEYDIGEWELSEASLPAPQRWTGTHTRVNLGLRRASLIVGRGEHEAARAILAELEEMAADVERAAVHRPVRGADGRAAPARGRPRRRARGDRARPRPDGVLHRRRGPRRGRRRRRRHGRGRRRRARARPRRGGGRVGRAARARRPARARRGGRRRARARSSARCCWRRARRRAAAPAAPTRPPTSAPRRRGTRSAAPSRPPGSRWREAEAFVAAGDRDAAAESLGAAHAVAVRLGAGWLRSEIEGLAARARLTLEVAAEAPEAEPAADEDTFGLTSRERQVLALVAEGATNREIGATLYMAEKTASVHVSRILGKLNVRSRTEAAAVAHRHGLSS